MKEKACKLLSLYWARAALGIALGMADFYIWSMLVLQGRSWGLPGPLYLIMNLALMLGASLAWAAWSVRFARRMEAAPFDKAVKAMLLVSSFGVGFGLMAAILQG